MVAPAEERQHVSARPSPAAKSNQATRRYNLVLPEVLYDELQAVADREGTSVVDVLRVFIKMGLLIDKVNISSDGKFLLRENNTDREIKVFF